MCIFLLLVVELIEGALALQTHDGLSVGNDEVFTIVVTHSERVINRESCCEVPVDVDNTVKLSQMPIHSVLCSVQTTRRFSVRLRFSWI